jgi:hypothetical protein
LAGLVHFGVLIRGYEHGSGWGWRT